VLCTYVAARTRVNRGRILRVTDDRLSGHIGSYFQKPFLAR
jgi:hypothetical protein